jgi:hypothetical protein
VNALVAIDEGDAGLGRGGGGEAGIVGEDIGLVVELADIHHIGALATGKDREFEVFALVVQLGCAVRPDFAFAHVKSLSPTNILRCNMTRFSGPVTICMQRSVPARQAA